MEHEYLVTSLAFGWAVIVALEPMDVRTIRERGLLTPQIERISRDAIEKAVRQKVEDRYGRADPIDARHLQYSLVF